MLPENLPILSENDLIIDDNQSDDLYEQHKIIIDKGQSPIRIDKYIMNSLEKISRSKVQNAIRAGSVLVDDSPIKPNYLVRPNQIITIIFPNSSHGKGVIPENLPLEIVYEDDDIIIINKQPGMVCHPGFGNKSGTLVNALAYHFKDLPEKDGNPGLCHRIDKDTSGLMIAAKNEYAMTHLAKQFYNHTIQRTYNALVWGQPDAESGTVNINIGRHHYDRLLFTTFADGDEGKHAITHYKVLEPMYYVSLVECKLETGRTHQIRVHMKHLGHTLFQDKRYGGDQILKGTIYNKYKQFVENAFTIMKRQALHAKTLGFIHPTTNKEMFFESELPEDFTNVLNKWRSYLTHRKKDE
jgi:23S rRNA pseudouridine1911/1915/1917 synthase